MIKDRNKEYCYKKEFLYRAAEGLLSLARHGYEESLSKRRKPRFLHFKGDAFEIHLDSNHMAYGCHYFSSEEILSIKIFQGRGIDSFLRDKMVEQFFQYKKEHDPETRHFMNLRLYPCENAYTDYVMHFCPYPYGNFKSLSLTRRKGLPKREDFFMRFLNCLDISDVRLSSPYPAKKVLKISDYMEQNGNCEISVFTPGSVLTAYELVLAEWTSDFRLSFYTHPSSFDLVNLDFTRQGQELGVFGGFGEEDLKPLEGLLDEKASFHTLVYDQESRRINERQQEILKSVSHKRIQEHLSDEQVKGELERRHFILLKQYYPLVHAKRIARFHAEIDLPRSWPSPL